jgi:hypothetical protein
MTQTMILVGILAICAVSGALLTYRPGWMHGPDEPTGSYTAPTPPVPNPPPAAAAPVLPPAMAPGPSKPSQPLPVARAAAPSTAVPVRRSRNSGFSRFAPAPGRTRTGRA